MKFIPQASPNHRDCETVHSLIPAYSLEATDAEETRVVEAHLQHCPEARAALQEYRVLADKLIHSAPLRQAPAHLGDQLLAAVEAQTLHRAPLPDAPIAHRETLGARPKPAFGMRASSYAFAALAAIVLLASNLYWFNQMAEVRQTQAQMDALLQGHNAVLALIGEGKTQRIELRNVQAGDSRAVLLCNPDEDVGFVYAEDFPALPAGDVYQVWLVSEDQRRKDAGVFQVDDEGEGTLIFQFTQPLRDFDAIEITREAAPGNTQPSSALVMQGTLPY